MQWQTPANCKRSVNAPGYAAGRSALAILLKLVAGVLAGFLIRVATHVTEMVTCIKVALPTTCPYQPGVAIFGHIAKLPP
jgi:hypothetical protein